MNNFFSYWFSLFFLLLSFSLAAQNPPARVAAGSLNSFAILPDGSLWAWGYNSKGQLGDNSRINRSLPVPAGPAGWQWLSVASGYEHTLAVRADGTLWAWGDNRYGQLGVGEAIPSSVVPLQVGTATSWASVVTTHTCTLALRTDGTLWAWGLNESGELGDGTLTKRFLPVQIGTATWQSLATAISYTCAVRRDGTLWSWGYDSGGALGLGHAQNMRKEPTQVGTATNWLSVSVGGSHTVAVRTDGSLWSWGSNIRGASGHGGHQQQYNAEPVRVGSASTWRSVAAGYETNLALRQDGTLWAWGAAIAGKPRENRTLDQATPVQVGTDSNWASVAVSGFVNTLNLGIDAGHAVATRTDGSIWAWGPNSVGQVGSAELTTRTVTTPKRIGEASNWVKAAGSQTLTMALRQDGTLWAWGVNELGQLGDGTLADQARPVQVGTATNWADFALSWDHVVAVQRDGSLWTWGYNYYGQLGYSPGPTMNQTTPQQVGSGQTWVAVAAGSRFTVALRADGTLWACGYNAEGQLGDGTTTPRTSLVPVLTPATAAPGTVWTQVKAGEDYTLATRSDHTLWAWGGNWDGQLGTGGASTGNSTPRQVGTDHDWQQVAPGKVHTEAIRRDGTLWGWGGGTRGQVGTGPSFSHPFPEQVGLNNDWISVSADTYNTAAIRQDGTLWTWGFEQNGQLGDGTTATRFTPAQMGTAANWASVDVSTNYSVATRTDGSLWAWGDNVYAQLGIPAYTVTPLLLHFRPSVLASASPRHPSVSFSAYPNPARRQVTVRGVAAGEPLHLLDLAGRVVRHYPSPTTILDLQGISPGLYLLRQGVHTTRLVVH